MFLDNPFKNSKITALVTTINSIYFNTNRNVFAPPSGTGYISEETLNSEKVATDEGHILAWVLRIQRYFLVNIDNTSMDSQTNTVELLNNFLHVLPTLSTDYQKYICSQSELFNCLIFTLLVSKNRELWLQTLEKIKASEADKLLILLLDWCFNYYFSSNKKSCENVLIQLVALGSETTNNLLKLPKSPICTLFRFVTLSQLHKDKSLELPSPLLLKLLPQDISSSMLVCMPYVIEQGVCAQLFTNQHPKLFNYLKRWSNNFQCGFRIRPLEQQQTLPVFYHNRFKIFLYGYIRFALSSINTESTTEELIGMAYLIFFYNPKSMDYKDSIMIHGLLLVDSLFDKEQYQLAYELYDELTAFGSKHENHDVKKAKMTLYCYFAKMDIWLKGKEKQPQFNTQELALIKDMSKLRTGLQNKLPQLAMFGLAKRLGAKRKACKSQLDQISYEFYYNIISSYLTKSQSESLKQYFEETVPSAKKVEVQKPVVVKSTPVKPIDKMTETVVPTQSEEIFTTSVFLLKAASSELPIPIEEHSTVIMKQEVSNRNLPVELVETTVDLPAIRRQSISKYQFWQPQSYPTSLASDEFSQQNIAISLPQGPVKQPSIPAPIEFYPTTIEKMPTPGSRVQINFKNDTNETYFVKNDPSLFAVKTVKLAEKNVFPIAQDCTAIHSSAIPRAVLTLIMSLKAQFPDTSFYLTGGAPANILANIKPNDYDIIAINADLKSLAEFVKDKSNNAEIRSKKSPVLYCEVDGIPIDLSVKNPVGRESVMQVLRRDFEQRDFSLNALYCELTEGAKLQIFSFDNAMSQREQGVIDSIKDRVIIFKEDPCRLFRLIKLLITYPNYKVAPELLYQMQQIKGLWLTMLQSYRLASVGNELRLDHAMKKLFTRFSYTEINTALHKLDLLGEFTSNSLDEANKACESIPDTYNANKLLYWVSVNYMQALSVRKDYRLTPIKSCLVLTGPEFDLVSYLQARIVKRKYRLYYYVPEAIGLYNSFALYQSERLVEESSPQTDSAFTYPS